MELQKQKTHQNKMTKWVDKQREKGVEPCFIQMKNSPDQKRPKMMKP
jgi:hypothetical protein